MAILAAASEDEDNGAIAADVSIALSTPPPPPPPEPAAAASSTGLFGGDDGDSESDDGVTEEEGEVASVVEAEWVEEVALQLEEEETLSSAGGTMFADSDSEDDDGALFGGLAAAAPAREEDASVLEEAAAAKDEEEEEEDEPTPVSTMSPSAAGMFAGDSDDSDDDGSLFASAASFSTSPVAAEPAAEPEAELSETEPSEVVREASPLPEPVAGADAAEAPLSLEERLNALYRKHNPTKLSSVSATAAKYAGNEKKLMKALKKKYGSSAVKEMDVNALTARSQGEVAVSAPTAATAVGSTAAPLSLEERLTALYRKHNPEKLDTISEMAAKYSSSSKQAKLLKKLKKKYGADAVNEMDADALAARSSPPPTSAPEPLLADPEPELELEAAAAPAASMLAPKVLGLAKEAEFAKNSYAMYEDKQNNAWVRVKIVKAHIDDPDDAYYTITLPNGREKQTVPQRLRLDSGEVSRRRGGRCGRDEHGRRSVHHLSHDGKQ